MTRVTLPTNGTGTGCYGLEFADGSKTAKAKPGTSVEISDEHYRALSKSRYAGTGLIGATQYSFGTKRGRWCKACRRVWNAWSDFCPRCKAPTQPA